MKLRLPRKAQRRAGVEGGQRGAIDPGDADQPGAMRGLQLLVELSDIVAGRHEQIAIDAGKVAVDRVVVDDALDLVDRGRVTFRREAGAVGAVQALEVVESIVERVDQVRRRPARLAARDQAIVNDDDPLSGLPEPVGRRQSGDPGADDADIGGDVAVEGRLRRHLGCRHPYRLGPSVVAVHMVSRRRSGALSGSAGINVCLVAATQAEPGWRSGRIDFPAAPPRSRRRRCSERDQERPFRLGGDASPAAAPARVVEWRASFQVVNVLPFGRILDFQ